MPENAGYREATVGTLSFYNHDGERRQTLYIAGAPESGKQTFSQRM